MEFLVAFNALIALISVWVIMIVNSKFIQPARINQARFRLYELRDNLALLAMREDLDEESTEYTTLLHLLNGTIEGTSTFCIVDFLKSLVLMADNKELQKELDKVLSNVDSVNPEYKEIVAEYFSVVHKLYSKRTRLLRGVIIPFLMLLAALVGWIKWLSTFKEVVLGKKQMMERLDKNLADNESKFSACVN